MVNWAIVVDYRSIKKLLDDQICDQWGINALLKIMSVAMLDKEYITNSPSDKQKKYEIVKTSLRD